MILGPADRRNWCCSASRSTATRSSCRPPYSCRITAPTAAPVGQRLRELPATFASWREEPQPGRGGPPSCCARREVTFVLTIPEDFSRALLRNEAPAGAAGSRRQRSGGGGERAGGGHRARARGPRAPAPPAAAGVEPGAAALFGGGRIAATTPKGSRSTTPCPGCSGVILTMTMVMMPALALTRELERGTMENPAGGCRYRRRRSCSARCVPYIGMGAVQVDDRARGRALGVRGADARLLPRCCSRWVAVFVSLATMGYADLDRCAQPDAGACR